MEISNTSSISQKPLVNIFWTGGWDSTFRVASLARKEVIIQPYYLKDNRKSESNELNAIHQITKKLQGLSTTKSRFNELVTMQTSDVVKDAEITNAYHKLPHLGSQYEWLARFAKTENRKGIEISVDANGNTYSVINTFGKLKKVSSEIKGTYYEIDPSESTSEINALFGNFHFPVVFTSKLEMKKEAEDYGFADIMNMTWSCHTPVKNKPCGVCVPCKIAIRRGMKYRFPFSALKRNMQHRIKHRILSLKKKMGGSLNTGSLTMSDKKVLL